METVDKRVVKICIEQFYPRHNQPETVNPDAKLIEDLCMDSLDLVELVMELEEEFSMEISDHDAEQWKTVGDVQSFIKTNGDF